MKIKMEQILCKCGCGQLRSKYDKWGKERRYIKGHYWKFKTGDKHTRYGRHHSEEVKEKISKSTRGEETRKKMSKAKMGERNPLWKGDDVSPKIKYHREWRRRRREKLAQEVVQ